MSSHIGRTWMEIIGKLIFPFKITIPSISQCDLWNLHVFHNRIGDNNLFTFSVALWNKQQKNLLMLCRKSFTLHDISYFAHFYCSSIYSFPCIWQVSIPFLLLIGWGLFVLLSRAVQICQKIRTTSVERLHPSE